jgi:kynureninase
MAALLSSLEIFHKVGMNELRQKSIKLTSYLEILLKSELQDNIEIITPLSDQSRGCQLSIRLKSSKSNITEDLREKGVICDWREPDVLRIAPVPLYNSFEDCHEFVQILKMVLNGS